MEIEDIQNRVYEFAKKRAEIKNFKLDQETCLIHLMEEVGELAEQIYNKKARKDKYDDEVLKEEIGDIILEAMILAKTTNMNLSEQLDNKIKELNDRIKNKII